MCIKRKGEVTTKDAFKLTMKTSSLVQCPKNNLNKKRACNDSRLEQVSFVYICLVYGLDTSLSILNLLQPWQARFLCGDSDYIFGTVYEKVTGDRLCSGSNQQSSSSIKQSCSWCEIPWRLVPFPKPIYILQQGKIPSKSGSFLRQSYNPEHDIWIMCSVSKIIFKSLVERENGYYILYWTYCTMWYEIVFSCFCLHCWRTFLADVAVCDWNDIAKLCVT